MTILKILLNMISFQWYLEVESASTNYLNKNKEIEKYWSHRFWNRIITHAYQPKNVNFNLIFQLVFNLCFKPNMFNLKRNSKFNLNMLINIFYADQN